MEAENCRQIFLPLYFNKLNHQPQLRALSPLVNGIFLVSLMPEVPMTDYIIGIDGGGTSCRAAVADRQGIILGRGKSGAANILTDPNNAIISITEAAKAAFRD